MSAVDLGSTAARRHAAALPVRLPLTEGGLRCLAEAAGVALPWEHGAPGRSRVAARLAGRPGAGQPSPQAAVAELWSLGLLDADGRVPVVVRSVLAGLARAPVAVDVDASRPVPGGTARLRAWHRQDGHRVLWIATAGGRFELGWCGRSRWRDLLGAYAAAPEAAPAADPVADQGQGAPAAELRLPLPLLVATGAAVRHGREQLLHELLRHHPDAVRAPDPLPPAAAAREVRLLHTGVAARLQVTVSGRGSRGDRRLGVVSWIRFGDGWRALLPAPADGVPWVAVTPVEPHRLAGDVARLCAGVRR